MVEKKQRENNKTANSFLANHSCIYNLYPFLKEKCIQSEILTFFIYK